MWKELRRKKLRSAPFPREWRGIIESHCAFYHGLPGADRRELEQDVQVFLSEKKFEGCGGLELTDEIKVTIAAFACLLLLHRPTEGYPALRTVLVYPGIYQVPTARQIGSGIIEESRQARAGESWGHGAVVLAWDAVREAIGHPEGGNVVLHEFAHQLDYEDGQADGIPLLGRREPLRLRRRRYADWLRVMRAEYERLRRGESAVLSGYGATNPAEFFAVATESFFGRPQELRRLHPELYGQMEWYYQQDPANWAPPAPSAGTEF